MLQLKRHEPFAVELRFSGDPCTCAGIETRFAQNGRTLLCKQKEDLEFDAEVSTAIVRLSGEETARFDPSLPAWVQSCVLLPDGVRLYSNAEELNVIDVLEREGRQGP